MAKQAQRLAGVFSMPPVLFWAPLILHTEFFFDPAKKILIASQTFKKKISPK